jgi:carboxyl-terminal processing protease
VGAAEVAAAALNDNKRAQLVGERTFGDAALRRAVPTEDGGAVLLAVAKYYAPSGKAIQETSVLPAYLVNDVEGPSISDEEEEEPAEGPAIKPGDDPVLKKALEVLNGTATPPTPTQQIAREPKSDPTPPAVTTAPPHQR